MICVKCHTLNISLTFSPVHCKTALSLPQSAISLCAGRVRVQESGHKGVGHTNTHTHTHTHAHTQHPLCLPNLRGSRRGDADGGELWGHSIHSCISFTNARALTFFSWKIYLYNFFFFFQFHLVFFPGSFWARQALRKEGDRQTDGQRDGQFV